MVNILIKTLDVFIGMCPSIKVASCSMCPSFTIDYTNDGRNYCKKCFLDICFSGVLRGDFPETATMQDFRKQIVECQIPFNYT